MIIMRTGDIFESEAEALVIPVNCVGVMGAGLAFAARQKFPQIFLQYKSDCREKRVRIGDVNVYAVYHKKTKWIFAFPTKENWRNASQLGYIRSGMRGLVETLQYSNARSVAIPKLGCGCGELLWENVKPIILNGVVDVPESVNIMVYE